MWAYASPVSTRSGCYTPEDYEQCLLGCLFGDKDNRPPCMPIAIFVRVSGGGKTLCTDLRLIAHIPGGEPIWGGTPWAVTVIHYTPGSHPHL